MTDDYVEHQPLIGQNGVYTNGYGSIFSQSTGQAMQMNGPEQDPKEIEQSPVQVIMNLRTLRKMRNSNRSTTQGQLNIDSDRSGSAGLIKSKRESGSSNEITESPNNNIERQKSIEIKEDINAFNTRGKKQLNFWETFQESLSHLIMLSVLGFMILVFLKKTSLPELNWQNVCLPLQTFTLFLGFKVHSWYSPIKEHHEKVYYRLIRHLWFNVILLSIFYFGLADCLNTQNMTIISRVFRLSPIYISIFSSFSIFLFLLPGFCDPELSSSKRMPFITLNYFLIAILLLIFLTINGLEVLSIAQNAFVLLFPIIFTMSAHLITILCENEINKSELLIVVAILSEIIIFSLEWDQSIIIRFSIALISWLYIYAKLIYNYRFENISEKISSPRDNEKQEKI